MGNELLLTPQAAADRIQVSRATLYELLQQGRIESIRIGRSRRIPVSALERFIETERREQAVPA